MWESCCACDIIFHLLSHHIRHISTIFTSFRHSESFWHERTSIRTCTVMNKLSHCTLVWEGYGRMSFWGIKRKFTVMYMGSAWHRVDEISIYWLQDGYDRHQLRRGELAIRFQQDCYWANVGWGVREEGGLTIFTFSNEKTLKLSHSQRSKGARNITMWTFRQSISPTEIYALWCVLLEALWQLSVFWNFGGFLITSDPDRNDNKVGNRGNWGKHHKTW